jgi:hypothetical protein
MKEINWSVITFIARPFTWFDEGSIALLDEDAQITHNNTGALFGGIHEGYDDSEYCDIFEFDWLDENSNCINSNIPYMEQTIQHDNYIIEDAETGIQYNWLENKIIN